MQDEVGIGVLVGRLAFDSPAGALERLRLAAHVFRLSGHHPVMGAIRGRITLVAMVLEAVSLSTTFGIGSTMSWLRPAMI